jgi:hypothetical protein
MVLRYIYWLLARGEILFDYYDSRPLDTKRNDAVLECNHLSGCPRGQRNSLVSSYCTRMTRPNILPGRVLLPGPEPFSFLVDTQQHWLRFPH